VLALQPTYTPEDEMKIYVLTDFEGACAVVGQAGMTLTESKQYDFARRMVTAEINAAVEGALAAGAGDIIVNDCHGSGLNLVYDELNPEARILLGGPRPRYMLGLDESFAGVFMIAYHAMAGTDGGVLSHSYSSTGIQNMWLNDVRIGEIGLDAALAGTLGVPVLLVTSDRAGTEEAQAILGTGVRTVAVKEGVGRNAAISLHPSKAQALIREAAEDAVRHAGGMKPLVFDPPYRLRREYKLESYVDGIVRRRDPTVTRIDNRTVESVSDDLFALV
jgi:D-amino peptidase